MRLKDSDAAMEKELIAYASKVVKALGIMNGPSHMELKHGGPLGPCLVEVGKSMVKLNIVIMILYVNGVFVFFFDD